MDHGNRFEAQRERRMTAGSQRTALTLVFVLAAFVASPAAGQGTGSIYGTVTDSSGAVVQNAAVEVTNMATGVSRSVPTGGNGTYLFSPAPVGRYSVAVAVTGFKRSVQSEIVVAADERSRVDFTLDVGNTTETVQVAATAPLVESSRAGLTTLVDEERVRQLPLNGRNALNLQTLIPGVTRHSQESGAENPGFSINGARGTMTNYTLDGGNAVDGHTNTPIAMPNPDALREFSVVSFPLSAEYGRGAGGQVNVVTRSGSNDFHGSAFEFFRNDVLNARSYFAPRRETLRQNQFGGTFGGRVIRNRTFFFGSYQGTLQRRYATGTINYLPSDLERQGDFSQSRLRPIDPRTGQAFPGDRIPNSRIDPASARFIQTYLPASEGGTGGIYRFNYPRRNDLHQYLAKVDHHFTDNNRLTARYFQHDNETIETSTLPTFLNSTRFPTKTFVVEDTHVFGPSVVNLLRYTRTAVSEISGPVLSAGLDDIGVNIHVPVVEGKKYFIINTPDFNASLQRLGNEARVLNQVSDTLTWVKGRHQIKLGADIRRVAFDLRLAANVGGQFQFGADFSKVAFGDFLLGLPTSFTQATPWEQFGRNIEPDFFFQDDVKLTRTFTVNFGLRWEPRPAVTEVNDRLMHFRQGQRSTKYVNAPVGILFSGEDGVPKGAHNSDLNNLAPRFGFAWDVFGDGRTSVRGGYGIFYDNLRWGGYQIQSATEPFARVVTLNAPGSFSNPYQSAGVADPFPVDVAEDAATFRFTNPSTFYVFDDNFRIGYVQQWNLTLEREVIRNSMIRLAYVGTKGTNLWNSRDLNYARYVPGQSTLANLNSRRPLAGIAGLDYSESASGSSYNSLQLTFSKRYSNSFTVLASYAWSKSLDNLSRGRAALEQPWPDDIRLNWGRSDFDITHVFVGSFVWDIPFLRRGTNLVSTVLGGWQLSSIINLRSGIPFTVTPGQQISFSGTGGERADLVGDPHLPGGRARNEWLNRYFNTAAFALPQPGSWGNAGRNILDGPGAFNIDAVLGKHFRFGERHDVEFRLEAFNALNRANFNNPQTNRASQNFGRITGSAAGRVAQLALKYSF